MQVAKLIYERGGALSFYRGMEQLVPEAALKVLDAFCVVQHLIWPSF